jgi:hypothetical protein
MRTCELLTLGLSPSPKGVYMSDDYRVLDAPTSEQSPVALRELSMNYFRLHFHSFALSGHDFVCTARSMRLISI